MNWITGAGRFAVPFAERNFLLSWPPAPATNERRRVRHRAQRGKGRGGGEVKGMEEDGRGILLHGGA